MKNILRKKCNYFFICEGLVKENYGIIEIKNANLGKILGTSIEYCIVYFCNSKISIENLFLIKIDSNVFNFE